jgi:hypothetical protein
MRSMHGFIVPVVAALVGALIAPAGAGEKPSPRKCEQTIARASGAFFIGHTAVVRKCEKRRAQGVLAPDVDCTLDEPMAGELSLLAGDLQRSIRKACGGPDETCGTPDDLSLAETGWHDVAACPDIDNSGCSGPIADCGDVAACVQCVGESASEQTRGVVADEFESDEFGTDSAANKCQVALVRGSTKFMQIATKVLGKCWAARLQGKTDGECPEDDEKTAGILAHAEKKKLEFICEACGGKDEACGGADDVTPEAIGFASDCPDLSVPSGSSCGGAILDLEDVVDCVDCVASFKAECVTRLAAPGAADYPPACNPGGGLCGNGVLDPGEECDPGAGSPDGAFDGSPGGAFCSEGRTCTAACVCVDGTTSTTITKTTTTSTTTRPDKKHKKCGNGKLEKWEKCDASAPNGLKRCKDDDSCHPEKCRCVDDDKKTTTTTSPPDTTTTTTTSPPAPTTTSTTTPPAPTTTSTTSPPAPTTTSTTLPPGSPSGAFT